MLKKNNKKYTYIKKREANGPGASYLGRLDPGLSKNNQGENKLGQMEFKAKRPLFSANISPY